MRAWLRTPFVLWRSGYALALYFVVALCIPFLLDLYSYWKLGLSVPLAFSSLPGAAIAQAGQALWLVFRIGVLLPGMLGLILVGVPLGRVRTFLARTRGRRWIYVFLSLCVGLSLVDLASMRMQVVSGFRLPPSPDYDFDSKFRFILDESLFRYFGLFGALTSAALVRIVGMIVVGDWGWFEKWSKYVVTARLSDLDGDFAPEHGRDIIDLTVGPCAAIRYAVTQFEHYMRTYWHLSPGSAQARSWVEGAWTRLQRDLDHLLSADLDWERRQFLLLPDWTDAWKWLVQRLPDPKCLFLLPHRDPNVDSLLRETAANVQVVDFSATFYSEPWSHQKSAIAASVSGRLQDGTTGVVLLSEVCHFTGRILPIGELMKDIRTAAGDRPLRFVIDGSTAVGNLRRPAGLGAADYYLFAGNSWLMAPQPCAVVIGTNSDEPTQLETESRAATLAALAAALDLWKELGPEQISTRSRDLTARFVARLDPAVALAGADSGLELSNVLAVKPRLGMHWEAKSLQALSEQLDRKRIRARIVEPAPGQFWLQFAFPYFLEGVDLDRAQMRLRELLRQDSPERSLISEREQALAGRVKITG